MLQKAKESCSQLVCGAAAETTATHIHQWKLEILCLINSPLTLLPHQYIILQTENQYCVAFKYIIPFLSEKTTLMVFWPLTLGDTYDAQKGSPLL